MVAERSRSEVLLPKSRLRSASPLERATEQFFLGASAPIAPSSSPKPISGWWSTTCRNSSGVARRHAAQAA